MNSKRVKIKNVLIALFWQYDMVIMKNMFYKGSFPSRKHWSLSNTSHLKDGCSHRNYLFSFLFSYTQDISIPLKINPPQPQPKRDSFTHKEELTRDTQIRWYKKLYFQLIFHKCAKFLDDLGRLEIGEKTTRDCYSMHKTSIMVKLWSCLEFIWIWFQIYRTQGGHFGTVSSFLS